MVMTTIRRVGGALALLLAANMPVAAQTPTTTVPTEHAFDELVERVKTAVIDHDLIVVYSACASCAAKGRGIDIPGNAVIGAFNNHFAVRMLEASVPAGIEAPIEFYVTGNQDGTASLTYQMPSDVFAPYNSPGLDRIADELDTIWQRIVEQSTTE